VVLVRQRARPDIKINKDIEMVWQKRETELFAEWRRDTAHKALWETANEMLPYDLKVKGYQFYVAWLPGDAFGRYLYRDYFAAALVKDGLVEKEWDYIPTLTDIFELAK
jgi:hypothetical protein